MRLIYNQGGIGHAREAQHIQDRAFKRQRFSSGEKMKIVQAVNKMQEEENITLGVAAARLGVNCNNLVSWAKNKTVLSDSLVDDRLSLHKGPMSILEDLKDELLEFITQWRDKGFPVSRMCLVRKICALKPEFREKTVEARKMAISRFLKKHNLTHRVATHKAQRLPGEVREEALAHLEVQIPRVNDACRHHDYVLNMDQTPVYHSMEDTVTIDVVGRRTINLRTAANDGQRVTVAATITASGRRVPSMVVFKGKLCVSSKNIT